jgi:hypothetical protein
MDAASLMARAAELTQRAADLLASGQLDEAEAVDREARSLRQRALRQARKDRAGAGSAPYVPAESERELVVEGLTELDAIVQPRLASDYLAARFSRTVSPRAFSALRRDEREAWKRGKSLRIAFVVPALEGTYFTQARGQLALSTWPFWRRLVGPRTGRVELLRAAENVLRQVVWIREQDEAAAARLERVLVPLVRTVPGTLDGWTITDADRTGAAIARELNVLREDDQEWREAAAKRGEAQLDDRAKLWGAPPPHLVGRSGGGRE